MEPNKRIKTLTIVILVKGILMLLLGVVHSIATYFEYMNIKNEMSAYLGIQYILWFLAMGVYLMFIGIIDIYTRNGLREKMHWAWKISLISAIFTFATGLIGVIGLSFQPSPPYLILLTGMFALYLLIANRKLFSHETT